MRARAHRGVLCLALLGLTACAPALPSFAGGRTVPRDRSDLILGGAVRVPVGDLVAEPTNDADDVALAYASAGGAVPVAALRYGATPDVDLGLDVSGANLRLMARGQLRFGSVRLIGALAGYGGAVLDPGAAGRLGASLPLTFAVDLFSVVELWIGVRAALEHVFGDLAPTPIALTGLRTGGVVGLAVGFRRVHVLLELGVDHEYWFGSLGGVDFERNGVALTPAFALRIRM